MKYTLILSLGLLFTSCGDVKVEEHKEELQEETIQLTFSNNIEGFNDFAKEFENLIKDSVKVSAVNKSNLSFAQLETQNFIDTNGLVGRRTSLDEDNIYELSSDFEFNAGEEVFESAIIYYFQYDSTTKSFVIVNMMMAG